MSPAPIFAETDRLREAFVNIYVDADGLYLRSQPVDTGSLANGLLNYGRLADDRGTYRIHVIPKAGA